MKKLLVALLLVMSTVAYAQRYACTTVPGDPMHTRIYTLDNGLTIYLTNNDNAPRIQTYIAVRAGGKNDPAESTGLAHYLEHLMFKGTSRVGTSDYAHERPLLDSIQALYEVYGHTTDDQARRAIYHRIDSFSYEASRYAIANEYDKLMAAIGSDGSNAYTSNDVTCYVEDIPANEVERWAMVQSDRFQDLVIRGFHTELESVYEEYNISLTRDFDKVDRTINAALFPHHPYGTQTVIGTQEHLKNPSLRNVLEYYRQWYVPNNVAICMSGDIANPDSIVGIVDRYFGQWRPNQHLPVLSFQAEEPLTAPIEREVIGREADMVALAWRFPGVREQDYDYLTLVDQLLCNDKAGLIDLNLNQAQQVMQAGTFTNGMSDYSQLWAIGYPKEGQSLQEVRQLILDQVARLRSGDFDESLLQAIIANWKRSRLEGLQSNEYRADLFVQSFINRVPWSQEVERIDRLSRITKQDIVDFAQRYLTDGYVCVYKRQGEDPNEKKIDKPQISPIEMNRDRQSDFVSNVLSMSVSDIQPVFADFDTDMQRQALHGGNELLYKHNDEDALFSLVYRVDRGEKACPQLGVACSYIDYLGTRRLSAEQLQVELYRLACDVSISTTTDRTYISISGLQENMERAMQLAEQWLAGAQPDQDIYDAMVDDILKQRQDEKLEQKANFSRLVAYGTYGSDNPYTHIMSAEQLQQARPRDILATLRDLRRYHQTIVYFGPAEQQEVARLVNKYHPMASKPICPQGHDLYESQQVTENEVLLAPYEAKNIYMRQYSNTGEVYSPALQPDVDIFNEYFGGGMNTIVFQELRESRGLAYSAGANYSTPSRQGMTNSFYTNIITQNDKMGDCLDVFHNIVEDMPLSPSAFALAREATLKRIATSRVVRSGVLNYYLYCRDHGIEVDPDQYIYNKVKAMTPQDLQNFQQQHVAGRPYRTLILGDEKELDMDKLRTLGPIRRLTTEEIFGY